MKLKIDLADLIDPNLLDLDLEDGGDDFADELDTLDQKIQYVKAAYLALHDETLTRHTLPQNVANWLFAALGDPNDTRKIALQYVYVCDGKAAALDGYRLHVHDVEGIADGAYYLIHNILIAAKDAPAAPPWANILPKGDGELIQVDSAEYIPIEELKIVQWRTPFKVTLSADYFADALMIGKPSEAHAYGSKIAVKLTWPNALAVIMPMNI